MRWLGTLAEFTRRRPASLTSEVTSASSGPGDLFSGEKGGKFAPFLST